MSARPTTFCADRADRIGAGMFMHWARPLLSDPPPLDGWLEVLSASVGQAGVTLTFIGGDTAFLVGDQLVLQGDNDE